MLGHPLRRRAVGGPAPRPRRHGRRPRRAPRRRRRHLAASCAAPGTGSAPALVDGAHLAVPAGARGRPAGAGAGPGRRPRHRAATRDPGRLARPRALLRAGRPAAARRQRRPRRLPARLARVGRLRRADGDARPDGRLPRPAGRRRAAHRCARRRAAPPAAASWSPAPRSTASIVRGGRAVGVRTARRASRTPPARCSPTSSRPHLFGGLVAEEHLPAAGRARHARLPARPRHREGGLGAPGPIPWAAPARARAGHRARRGLRRAR